MSGNSGFLNGNNTISKSKFDLLQGHHCSRCMFNSHCRGCPIEMEGSLVLSTGDCLAAMFVKPVHEISPAQSSALLLSSMNKPLSLYDCVQAFSQR